MIRVQLTATKATLAITIMLSLLTGCATSGGMGGGLGNYAVGPKREEQAIPDTAPTFVKPFMVVSVFDPNIPEDKDTMVQKAIWPELRRTEAVRMAVTLGDKLADTNAFDGVRTTPGTETSAHLYTLGKIITSNGEELDLNIEVVSIEGDKIFSKNYRFTVDEYSLEDPRKGKDADLYHEFFVEIANDIAQKINKIAQKSRDQIARIEELRYAEFFEPNFSSQYTDTNWMGNVVVTSYPSDDDPMIRRIRSLKVKDQMFIDNLQSDYRDFYDASNAAYVSWQRAAFIETKAAREASAKATGKAILGVLAVAAGAVVMANSGDYDYSQTMGGAALAVGGLSAIGSAMGDSKQAEAHRESLSELGKSLNVEIAPKVMELEETQVELNGTATEQYATWRSALKQVYQQEKVPDVEL